MANTPAQFNHTTLEIVKLVIAHLVSLGHTGLNTGERWECDGVWTVHSKQSLEHHWTLDISGIDNPHFDPGVSFDYSPSDAGGGAYIVVDSLEHLTELIKAH